MKRMVSFLFLVVLSFVLVSCAGMVLEKPNATISGNTLSWNAVEGALQYYVYIDDVATPEAETTFYTVSETTFDLTTVNLADGSYSVYVVAVAGTTFSAKSDAVSYVVGDGNEITLSAPTNVSLTDSMLSWSAVANATGYTIYIGTIEVDVTTTTYDLSQQNLEDGTYAVYVVATTDTVTSDHSTTINYVVYTTIILDAPTNVSLTDSMLSWSAVANATGYTIYIGTIEVDVTTTTYDLSQQSLEDGTYVVYVVATTDTVTSDHSTTINYVVYTTIILDAPTNVAINDGIMSWDAVIGATGYVVTVNGNQINVTTTSYDLSLQELVPGDYPVTVKAVATEAESPQTTAVTFTVTTADILNTTILGVLQVMDDSYELDMTINDFGDTGDFERYMESFNMATVYASASYNAGLGSTDAISFFSSMADLVSSEEDLTSLADLLEATDMFAVNHVTPEIAAHLVLTLLTSGLEMNMYSLTERIANEVTYMAQLQLNLSSYKANVQYAPFLALIAQHIPSGAEEVGALIANNDRESAKLLSILVEIAYDKINENYHDSEYYYYNFGQDVSIEHIEQIMLIVEDILSSVSEFNIPYIIHDITYTYDLIDEMNRYMNQMNLNLERMENLQVMLGEQQVLYVDALEMIFDFALTVHDTFPEEVVALIDGALSGTSQLTTAEIVLIKDELVQLILDALPLETDFQYFFEALLMVAEVGLNNDINALQDHADYLGSVSYHMMHMELLFLGDITATDVEDAMDLVNAIQTAYMGELSQTPLDDPIPLIHVLLFIRNHLTSFATEHATEMADLEALINQTAMEPLYQEIISQLRVFAEADNPRELDMILYILDALSNQYDDVMSMLEMVDRVGVNVVNAFIDSQGSILSAIGDISQMETQDLSVITTALEDVIDEIALYHDLISAELTSENIETILSIMVIPIMIETGLYEEEGGVTEAAMRALIPDIAQVLMNIASLEADLFDSLDAMVIGDYINMTNGFVEPVDFGSALGFIHMFDDVLTTENETLISDTIDLIFTNILSDTTLQQMLNINPLDLPQDKTDIEDMISQMMTQIHTFAALDILTLTEQNEIDIMQFAGQFNLFINTRPSFEEGFNSANELTLDVPETTLYRTDTLYYSFTPSEAGYYMFEATYPDMYDAHVTIYDSNMWWLTSDWSYDTSIDVSGFLMPGETIYILLDIDRAVYVDVVATITASTDVTSLSLDTPETLVYQENSYIYEFTTVTSGYYEFTLTGALNMYGRIRLIGSDGKDIAHLEFYEYDQVLRYYVDAQIDDTFYIEIETYYETDAIDLMVSEFSATTLLMDTPLTVNENGQTQYVAFTAPHTGFYDVSLISTLGSELHLGIYSNQEFREEHFAYLMAEDPFNLVLFLKEGHLYIFQMDDITASSTFDLTITQTNVTVLSQLSSNVIDTSTYNIYTSFVAEETGFYVFGFNTDASMNLWMDVINSDGYYIYNYYEYVNEIDGYERTLLLQEGTYYLTFNVDVEAELIIDVLLEPIPIVYAYHEIDVVITDSQDNVMLFTPEQSGEYMIYSYNDDMLDPKMSIYDHDGYEIGFADDTNDDFSFEMYLYLEADQTYIIHFGAYDESAQYNAMIEKID